MSLVKDGHARPIGTAVTLRRLPIVWAVAPRTRSMTCVTDPAFRDRRTILKTVVNREVMPGKGLAKRRNFNRSGFI